MNEKVYNSDAILKTLKINYDIQNMIDDNEYIIPIHVGRCPKGKAEVKAKEIIDRYKSSTSLNSKRHWVCINQKDFYKNQVFSKTIFDTLGYDIVSFYADQENDC